MRRRSGARSLAAVLFTDIVDSTAHARRIGDRRWKELIGRHHAIVRRELKRFGGRELDTAGDGFFASFSEPAAAIRCACASVEAVRQLGIEIRTGVHFGECEQVGSKLGGLTVVVGARVMSLGGAGDVLITGSTRELVGGADLGFEESGRHALKGVDGEWQVFAVTEVDGVPRPGPIDADEAEQRLAAIRPTGPIWRASRKRHPIGVALVALVLIGAIAVPTTIALRGNDPAEPIVGDAMGIIDLESGELKGSVSLESRPGAVAVSEGSVWVTLPDRGDVIQIDAKTMTIRDTVSVGANPVDIAVGADSIWVANGGNSTVSRISAATNEVVATIEVPGAPAAVAVNDEGVWVADSVGDSLTHIDPKSGAVLVPISVGDQPVDIAEGGEELWVANAASGSVSGIHLGGNFAVQPVDVGNGPQAVAVGADGIWVVNSLDGTVSRFDPDTGDTDRTIPVGEDPTDLAVVGGDVWVSIGSSGSVKKIDPASESIATIPIGSFVDSVAVVDETLWVSVRGPSSGHRGGTLTVVGPRSQLGPIDPALANSVLGGTISAMTNDGLVGLKRIGGVEGATMVPNLAKAIPVPADGGTTYTFQLRRGIRYSTGDVVKPEDFRWAIERVFLLGSWGSSYYETIVGAAECRPGSCDLSSGIETDDDAGTVSFHLVRADPDFLNKLSLSFAFAVPAETLAAPTGADPTPATGPYLIERHSVRNGRAEIVLVRNPEFRQWSAARPDGFPDQIVFRLGPDSDRQVNAHLDEILEGTADVMYNPPPAERIAELKTTNAGQLHSDPFAATRYMFVNTHIPPFDNELARQALNYAVDRGTIVDEVWGGAVRLTCQILPPTFPGYDPYCPYTRDPESAWTAPDPAKAQELVDLSGTAGGRVTVWATPDVLGGFGVPIGKYFVDLLNQLGYRATLEVVPADRYFPRRTQMAYLAWAPDYLAESGFIPGLTCIPTGIERFCDPILKRNMKRATSRQLTDPAASHELWSFIEHDLIDSAPWVPLGNPLWTSMVSERLGNYQFHPLWAQLYDQMWVR